MLRVLLISSTATIALEKSNMESLRMMQHKDVYGNPIGSSRFPESPPLSVTNVFHHLRHNPIASKLTKALTILVDPDLSNPTRHRLERPLDTIRSFEAAIDGSYNNRRTSYRPGMCQQMLIL